MSNSTGRFAARAEQGHSRRNSLASSVALAAGLPALAWVRAAESEGIPTIGDAPQLFVDLPRIDKVDRVKQIFHSVQKDPS